MFSRSVARAARTVRTARATPTCAQLSRTFTNSATKAEPAPEIPAATEVKSSAYVGGSIKKSTIKVDQNDVENTGPLSQATYKSLPPTMQKYALVNKVVIVTGYFTFHLPQ